MSACGTNEMADEGPRGGFVAREDVEYESAGADLLDHSVDGGAAARSEPAELCYCGVCCAASWVEK